MPILLLFSHALHPELELEEEDRERERLARKQKADQDRQVNAIEHAFQVCIASSNPIPVLFMSFSLHMPGTMQL
jgi:hypothetical protein